MFFEPRPDWQEAGQALVARLLEDHRDEGLAPDGLGLVILGGPAADGTVPGFAYRGDWRCYPCSLVKTFHLVHALHRLEAGGIAPHAELDRAMADMIRWSSNTATNYVIDILSGTTGDTLLSGPAWDDFVAARQGLDRWFAALGWPEWQGATIRQKLMDDTRYGRERQLAGADSANLNALNPALCARLMHAIFTPGALLLGEAARYRAIAMLARSLDDPDAANPRYQLAGYLAPGLPRDARLWSKSGHNEWTGDPKASWFKHDLIRVEAPGHDPLTIAVMTQGKGLADGNEQAFARIAEAIWAAAAPLLR